MSNHSELSQQEIEDYGAEFLGVVEKKARSVAAQQTADLKNQVAQLQNQLHRNGRSSMMDYLDRSIPNWRAVNESDGFLEWLSRVDGYSGVKRHELLKQAWANNE
jgi:hypothetical protein